MPISTHISSDLDYIFREFPVEELLETSFVRKHLFATNSDNNLYNFFNKNASCKIYKISSGALIYGVDGIFDFENIEHKCASIEIALDTRDKYIGPNHFVKKGYETVIFNEEKIAISMLRQSAELCGNVINVNNKMHIKDMFNMMSDHLNINVHTCDKILLLNGHTYDLLDTDKSVGYDILPIITEAANDGEIFLSTNEVGDIFAPSKYKIMFDYRKMQIIIYNEIGFIIKDIGQCIMGKFD